ncbi:MAG: hypothetical protein NTW17_03400 [Candidatus Pacearchaeota archaeon]|nr:hypothetical protein [Candidatus Pacearchaeota archaeon]
MKRGGNKRGQFYLVAAIILTMIIISIATISNYSKRSKYSDLNSLKDELQIESARVLDYGIHNQLTQVQMNELIQNFTQDYINSESSDKNLYFVFGTQSNITLKLYQNNENNVFLDNNFVTNSSGTIVSNINPAGENINLTIDTNSYTFDIKSGENFYFVISKEAEGEEYVVTG